MLIHQKHNLTNLAIKKSEMHLLILVYIFFN